MNAARHSMLAALPFEARALLHALAVESQVTVDDVVSAALGRAPVPPAAVGASKDFLAQFPAAPAALTEWPFACPVCSVDAPALGLCSGKCGRRVCNKCGAPGCPSCQGARALRQQADKRAAAERDESLRAISKEST